MVPTKLTLTNFLSYGSDPTVLDFSSFRLACLSGRNGHGKSAILDAVTWALWGRCRVRNSEEVINRGGDTAAVELEFEVERNSYRILRQLQRKKRGAVSTTHLQVYDPESGQYKPLGEGRGAQAEISKLLKMDFDSFICSSFILQGMADEFTKRTPVERKNVLSKILNLDRYEQISKKSRERSNTLGHDIDLQEKELERIEAETANYEALKAQLKLIQAEEKKVRESIAAKEKEHVEIIKQFETLRASIELHNKYVAEIASGHTKLDEIKKEYEALEDQIKADNKIIEREGEITAGYKEYERLSDLEREFTKTQIHKSKLETEVAKAKNRIKDKRAKIERELSTLKGKEAELERTLGGIAANLKNEDKVQEGYKKLVGAKAEDATMQDKRQSWQEFTKEMAEVNSEISKRKIKIETKITELSNQLGNLNASPKRLVKIREEHELLLTKIEDAKSAETQMQSSLEDLKALDENIKVLQSKARGLEGRSAEETEKLAVLETEHTQCECPLCETQLGLEAKEALIDKLRGLVDSYQSKLATVCTDISRAEKKKKLLNTKIKKLEKSVLNLDQLVKSAGEKWQELKNVQREVDEYERLSDQIAEEKNILTDGSYAGDLKEQLTSIQREIDLLGYSEDDHKLVTKTVRELEHYGTEHAMLVQDKKNKGKIEKEIASIKNEIQPIQKKLEEGSYAKELYKKADEIENELSKLEYNPVKHNETKKDLEAHKEFVKDKEGLESVKLSAIFRLEQREKLVKETESMNTMLANLEKEVEKTKGNKGIAKDLESRKQSNDNTISALKEKRDGVIERRTSVENSIDRIEGLSAKKNEVLGVVEKIRYDISVFKELSTAFGKNGIQALIIENAVPEIEQEANRILSRLTDGAMLVSLEMLKPRQSGGERETLEIAIADSSGTRSYETFSGGEAFRIDFALRVAISKFIANRSGAELRTLVVDEGFGTQDKEGLELFVNVIDSIKDDFDLILAITHVDELKERFPVRIDVTKEPGIGSRVETVYL